MKKVLKHTFLLTLLTVVYSLHSQTTSKLPCIDKKFSIVAHIVMDSTGVLSHSSASIINDIAAMNLEFAPICVSFELCSYDTIVNYWYNEVYKDEKNHWAEMQTLYNVKNRINIYYVKDIKDPAGAGGFADLGSITNLNSGGIVIKTGGVRTISHEMGHYFGLEHTFEPGGELVNGSNCSSVSDRFCDTPADPFIKGDDLTTYVDGSCKFISMKKDANGQYYNPLVGNIMSYYPESCACSPGYGFTHDQFVKMAETYLSNPGMW